jgi:hypothetical protein
VYVKAIINYKKPNKCTKWVQSELLRAFDFPIMMQKIRGEVHGKFEDR